MFFQAVNMMLDFIMALYANRNGYRFNMSLLCDLHCDTTRKEHDL